MPARKIYTTDLSDREWCIIEPLLPAPKRLGRKIEYCRREMLNAIFYLNRNGCTWRDFPGDFPPYGIVSHYYHTWRRCGLWQALNETLRRAVLDTERWLAHQCEAYPEQSEYQTASHIVHTLASLYRSQVCPRVYIGNAQPADSYL